MSNQYECILCLSNDNVPESSMALHEIKHYRNQESKCKCKYMIHQGCYEHYLRQYNAECMICKKELIYFDTSPKAEPKPVFHPLIQAPAPHRQVSFNENIQTIQPNRIPSRTQERIIEPRPYYPQPTVQVMRPEIPHSSNVRVHTRNNDLVIDIDTRVITVDESPPQRNRQNQHSSITRYSNYCCLLSIVSLIGYIIVEAISN